MSDAAVIGRHEGAVAPNLRRILGLDAATCFLMGALLVAATSPLSTVLGLPQDLLFWAGVLLFPCAALMGGAAMMRRPLPLLVWIVILGNAAWVMASVAVAMVFEPPWIGVVFVIVQATVVLLLLILERRAQVESSLQRE